MAAGRRRACRGARTAVPRDARAPPAERFARAARR
ncbi:hypothetical protein BDSB_13885 [Burkholderia dolosa PC543]|nr:hypothetical protein BDSB_13885 [Burkholderia dolosa PC543]